MSKKTPDFAEVSAKMAITEVVHRYCRGIDRMDRALTLSCWHPGGTDDHAPLYAGSAEGFIQWLWPEHQRMTVTRHAVSNTLIQLDGDHAGVESYWNVTLQVPHREQLYDIVSGGRYLDRFECIDDIWAIRHRQSVLDWHRVDSVGLTMADFAAQPLINPNNPEVTATLGRRDRDDCSYSYLGLLNVRAQ